MYNGRVVMWLLYETYQSSKDFTHRYCKTAIVILYQSKYVYLLLGIDAPEKICFNVPRWETIIQ